MSITSERKEKTCLPLVKHHKGRQKVNPKCLNYGFKKKKEFDVSSWRFVRTKAKKDKTSTQSNSCSKTQLNKKGIT